MREVTGPIIATTAVLMAVFVPVAFLPGVTGRLYNQFALTIAISVAISAFNSLTLSPALVRRAAAASAAVALAAVPRLQRRLHLCRAGVCNGIRRVIGARWVALALFAAGLVAHLRDLFAHSGGLPAGRGPGLLLRGDPAAGRRLAAADRGGRREGSDDPGGAGRGDGCGPGHRHEFPDRRQSIEFGGGIRHAQAMGRARREAHRLAVSSPRSAPSSWPYRTRSRSASIRRRSPASRPPAASSSRSRT